MSRTEIRELAFKLVYSLEIQGVENIDDQIDTYLKNEDITEPNVIDYIKDIVIGINNNSQYITEIIKKSIDSKWTISRISKINLSILKLAIYEIKFKSIPFKAEINEAVELAKKYGEETSSRFVNGALAKALKEMNVV